MEVSREAPLEVIFRGRSIGTFYADLIVDRTVLVEIKASATIEGYAVAQTLNYLKVAGGGVGLLLNFGHKPEFKRLVIGRAIEQPAAVEDRRSFPRRRRRVIPSTTVVRDQ
jgi:GxxExxY protein